MNAIKSEPLSGHNRLLEIRDILKRIVLNSVRVKAHVVSADEREGGLRNLLNFGHSIGHAIEGILTPQILHGECISIGMVLEAMLARHLGVLSPSAVSRLTKCILNYNLPISVQSPIVQQRSGHKACQTDQLLSIMGVDKKNDGKKKRVVLLSGIGRTYELRASVVTDRNIRFVLSSAIEIHPLIPQLKRVVCTPPGSKSISNRALVLAALGTGKCRIRNLLHSDDTEVMLRAVTELQGAQFSWENRGELLVVDGSGGRLQASDKELYLGNAGTASRFLATVATLAEPASQDYSVLTGNARMKKRPVGPLVDALRENGASIAYMEDEGSLPLKINASRGMQGGEINLAATVSSQYVSSILMCAPYAKKPVTLRLVGGRPISQPYINMTAAMMASFGIEVTASKVEEHTYYIPQGRYRNPEEYNIESDASSATYPLAVAAITGTTCTIPNVGFRSLQGDARFAVEVLKPMGCIVEQTESSTTVTGPERGTLKSLIEIDMEPMTDAFLTASVLAAVAQARNSENRTRIIGIANQRVKECNRIKAMKDQLAKFGVKARELDDGIEIDGVKPSQLQKPIGGVHCYDDHRVAMSFSVLAAISPQPTTIPERDCIGKTWPGWWDELSRTFGLQIDGVDPDISLDKASKATNCVQRSLFIIGMRGAGKTTAGQWAAKILGWPFIDLDLDLEEKISCTIPNLIRRDGWQAFRDKELSILKQAQHEKAHGHVFACGGGIVESAEARQLLISHRESGGIVLFIQRDVENVMDFLGVDKTRPAYAEDMRTVWMRRQPWYYECSNYEYFVEALGPTALGQAPEEFARFLLTIAGRKSSFDCIKKRDRSFFVALTVPEVSKALSLLDEVVVGSDAVELRVDLLDDKQTRNGLPKSTYVAQQVQKLRAATKLPIIFTIRTCGQGGKFPDHAHQHAKALYQLALRLGVEFVDLEIQYPEDFLYAITQAKGHSKIITSHHDPKKELQWGDGSWVPFYNKALQYGDIVKLVGVASQQEDNIKLMQFRLWAQSAHETPIIAINMEIEGQLSRIQNHFLTPVSHPALPYKAAPGQLSAAQIRLALSLHGTIKPKQFYLFGSPISLSRSPSLHNKLFKANGLPHRYDLFETDTAQKLEDILRTTDFGGASITIPLKLGVMQYLDEVHHDARVIGAVNTIIVDPVRTSTRGRPQYLIGANTDWKGMMLVLDKAGAQYSGGQSALVIGSGGTARAAIYALHKMGYCPLYIIGRTHAKVNAVIETFPLEYNLQMLGSQADIATLQAIPTLAIGTIPADRPIEPDTREILCQLLKASSTDKAYKKILLEMAYKPATTALMQLVTDNGWETVRGLEALAGQGFYQVRTMS